MAERLDGNLATLKAVVIVMGILIMVGTRTISLPSGCTVAQIAGVGDRLVLRLEPAASCPDLIYLDASGREVGRVELAPAP
jgi:hypothetical protein